MAGLSGAVFALGMAQGCGSSAPPPEAPKPCDKQFVTLDLYASGNLNPNENGNPRPVVVRLYQLASDLKLSNARYDDVLNKADETLGKDIIKVDEVTVFPNDHYTVKFERMKDAAFLGGVALVHEPRGQSWKTFYEFPLAPGEATCGGRAADGGGIADPQTSFFLDLSKIDNGSQYDESMFPNARPAKKITLPKRNSSEGTAAGAAPVQGAQ